MTGNEPHETKNLDRYGNTITTMVVRINPVTHEISAFPR